jgi:acetyl esterase/lipase
MHRIILQTAALWVAATFWLAAPELEAEDAAPTSLVLHNVVYGKEMPEAQVLSACLVRARQPSPVLVQIISGGWNSSPPRGTNLHPFQAYLDAGLSVVMVAHRSVSETVHWPAPVDDVARAIQFIRAHATDWGIDPKRIAVKGRSSGGHVALMVGFGPDRAKPGSADPVERQSSLPTCILAGSAPTDLPQQMNVLLKDSNRQGYLWERMCALLGVKPDALTVEELVGRLKPLSPCHIVTKDAPPVLLLHPGPADAFWPGDARLKWDVHTPITGLILARRLKELGVAHELAMLPEGQEGGRGAAKPSRQEAAFLQRHLHLPNDPGRADQSQAPRLPSTGSMSTEEAALMARFENPKDFLPASGAGGTEWDAQYRCFIQTDADAVAKGLPTHAEAARRILADAAGSAANLDRHLGWVLHIKHFSQTYRPESATVDLRRLYADLVDLKLGVKPAAQPDGPGNPGNIRICRDVIYGLSHPAVQKLDAYLVKSDQPTPAVIEIHGGGWRRGSKGQFVYPGKLIDDILAAGISVISADYRLAPEHPMPAQTEDVVRTVQFVRSMAHDWNIDSHRIAALGGSAGAHLSAWVALHDNLAKLNSADPVERQSSRLAAFVDISGPMDLLRARPSELAKSGVRGADFAAAFTGAFACTAEQYETDPVVRQRIREASPLYLVSPGDPPAFIMHAAAEAMSAGKHPAVPEVVNDPHGAWHGVLLADALQRAGVSATCRIGPEVGKDPVANNAAIVGFLKRHLNLQ